MSGLSASLLLEFNAIKPGGPGKPGRNNVRFIILTVLAALLLVACAATETNVAPQPEKEFVTGSNIPRKDRSGSGVTVASKESLERFQNASGGPTQKGSGSFPSN
jgi:hypothetical protein